MRYIRWSLAGAFVLAAFAIIGTADPGSWPILVASLGFMAVILGVVAYLRRTPSAMAYIFARQSVLRAIAVVVGLLPFVGMVPLVFLAPNVADRFEPTTIAIAVGGVMIASLLWTLPGMARNVQDVDRDLPTHAAKPSGQPRLLALVDVLGAWRAVLQGFGIFVQLVLPWIGMVMAALVWSLWETNHLQHGERGMAVAVLLILLAAILAGLYVVPATVVVSWSRWVLRGERPAGIFSLPGRAVFSLAWRLWISLMLLGTADGYVTKFLQKTVGGRLSETLSAVGYWALLALMLGLSSSAALRLPAIAIGDNDFNYMRAVMIGRRLWPTLPVGLVLSIAPFLAAAGALGLLIEALMPGASGRGHGDYDVRIGLLVGFAFVLVLAGVASAAGFLAKGYEAAKAELAS